MFFPVLDSPSTETTLARSTTEAKTTQRIRPFPGREDAATMSSVLQDKKRGNLTQAHLSRRRENVTPHSQVATRRREETTAAIEELPPIPALLEAASAQRLELRTAFNILSNWK
jgi:hypothetical protein